MIPRESTDESSTLWFMDLRNVALLSCIAAVLSSVSPLWNMIQLLLPELRSQNPSWWIIPAFLLVCFLGALMPTFLYALYRDKTPLQFSRWLRYLAAMAAIMSAICGVALLPTWFASFRYWLATNTIDWSKAAGLAAAYHDPATTTQLANLINMMSNVTLILLLVVLCRPVDGAPEEIPISRFLRITTNVTVIVYGAIVAALFLRLVFIQPISVYLRNEILRLHGTPPSLQGWLVIFIQQTVPIVCIFVPPFMIFREARRRRKTAVDSLALPPEPPDLTALTPPSEL
jgi:hypothetical protein